jgi:hypothetical protein
MKRNGKPLEPPRPLPRSWKAEYDWAFSQYEELAKQYPNEWIAFADRRVLAHGKALMTVLTQAKRKVQRREIPHLFVERGIHVYAAPR